jgi:hypothetical protein
MNNPSFRKNGDFAAKAYVASGAWKCPTSPTGAHWWNCNVEPFVCKICGKINQPPVNTEAHE